MDTMNAADAGKCNNWQSVVEHLSAYFEEYSALFVF